jgi:hypothetical protein
MSAEMIQSAYIGLCLRYAEGEDVRHLVSDDLCVMPLLAREESGGSSRGSADMRQKGGRKA